MAVLVRSAPPSGFAAQRLNPGQELEELHGRMDQLMESILSGSGIPANGAIWAPPVDLEETEDAWIVEAELPGVRKKDVNVDMRDSELVISGEIKEKERKGLLRRRTRRTGQFEYRVTLPGEVDPDKIDASLNDGVLTVRIPKAEGTRTRRIEVGS